MSDRYVNRVIAVLEGHAGADVFAHEGEAYRLQGYLLLDPEASNPVETSIKEARRALDMTRIRKPSPLRGFELGRHFVLVIDRAADHGPVVWSYSKPNGTW
jgi:hypothetical protein